MVTLSKKARVDIATLVNDVGVACRMQALGNNRDMWTRVEAAAAVTLADKYGIELPGLRLLREYLDIERAAA